MEYKVWKMQKLNHLFNNGLITKKELELEVNKLDNMLHF